VVSYLVRSASNKASTAALVSSGFLWLGSNDGPGKDCLALIQLEELLCGHSEAKCWMCFKCVQRVCVCERERECVCARERVCVCVCVCVCV
jgi:hypothetical protein